MTLLLTAKDIALEYPTKRVFDAVTMGITTGQRIGIVGKNGGGKSTLLAVLSGLLAVDSGEVTRQSNVTVGVLSQLDTLDLGATVAYAVVGDMPEHEWAAKRTTRDIIQTLIGDIAWSTLIGELSGGQRRRVDLARLLIGDWDVLMLDEPTNHLDVAAISWLAGHLKTRWSKNSGALLVVTHDRWFLDEVCLSMWEVHDGVVDPFEGGYSAYIQQRVERDRVAAVTEQKRQNLMRKELAWLARGPKARTTKAKFRIDAAKALIADEPPARNPLELQRMAMARLGKQVVDVIDASAVLGGRTIIDDVTWLIGPGDRFGILGENGAGKTTLLNLIQGSLEPAKGHIKIGKTVKFATLSQHLTELEILADERVREVLKEYKTSFLIDGRNLSPAQLLERLGFEKNHLQARVSDLSGGQRRQLRLMLVLMEEPNVLILDEPSNDLDTDMLAAVEDLLDSWPGTLLIVSHDRYLMERVTDHQFMLLDGRLRHVPGGVDEYLQIIEGKSRPIVAQVAASESEARFSEPPSEPVPVLKGAEMYRAKKSLVTTERKLAKLEGQLADAVVALEQSETSNYMLLLDREKEIADLKSQISEFETQWVELTEALGQ